jgi:hypothetical protein
MTANEPTTAVPQQSEADFRKAILAYLKQYWDWQIHGVAEPWLVRELGMDRAYTFTQRINYHRALAALAEEGVIAVQQIRPDWAAIDILKEPPAA